jgi:hypothetical protein
MVAQPPTSPVSTPSTAAGVRVFLIEQILAKLQALPSENQQQVLDFVEFLVQKTQAQSPQKTLWDQMDELMDKVPDETWETMPTDGSYQHDHYLYGAPKRE